MKRDIHIEYAVGGNDKKGKKSITSLHEQLKSISKMSCHTLTLFTTIKRKFVIDFVEFINEPPFDQDKL